MPSRDDLTPPADPGPYQPSLQDVLLLDMPVDVKVSPDGRCLAFRVRTTNWQDNRYDTLCYVHDRATGRSYPVTRHGSVTQIEWMDDLTLATLWRSSGNSKAQIYLYEGLVGDGWLVTHHKTGVAWFKPFGDGLVFRASDPERSEQKSRANRFGTIRHFEQEPSASALYYVGLPELRAYESQAKRITEDEAGKLTQPVIELSKLLPQPLSIRSVAVSRAGDALYLTCWPRDDLVCWNDTTAFCVSLDPGAAVAEHLRRVQEKSAGDQRPADGAEGADVESGDAGESEGQADKDVSYLGDIQELSIPQGANVEAVSPDGSRLLMGYRGRDLRMYTRRDLWIIDAADALAAEDPAAFAGAMRNITASLDRQVLSYVWGERGIFGAYADRTHVSLALFGEDGGVEPVDVPDVYPVAGFDISDGGCLAFVGTNAERYPEIYVADPPGADALRRILSVTDFGGALDDWRVGPVETIRWTSRDGTEIEGVLRRPADFDPAQRYPLVLVVHGGPRWFSPEYLISSDDKSTYPSIQFVNKGILVLKPNYRGSLGRGQSFAELNVNNLGVGDLWDMESAVEHLVELGWVDPERVGCMGWSQGGYISAFAGLHSEAFKAVSVGAGISDWYTYHISNDIPQFTVDYLSGSPFDDRALYEKTAPMSNIANAATPMLIQHGSDDPRVPFSNAMELYRGLKAHGVPVELFVYPGMRHPITRPRENHAVMYQNLAWFSHYLLGEELELE